MHPASKKEDDMADDNNQPKQKSTGYGKRPVWQWVVIYAVVAVIVYGLVYYLFINGGSDSGGGNLGY